MKRFLIVLLFGLLPAAAQTIKFPANLDKLKSKASEVVDVNMDANLLQLAGRFLSDNDPDQAKARKLVSGLKGIYVKSFEFEKEGEYQPADLEAVRSQLAGPEWMPLVTVRSQKSGENVDVYLRGTHDKILGLVVIAAEPKELTFVHIDGALDPDQLNELSGHFGVPKMKVPTTKKGEEPKK